MLNLDVVEVDERFRLCYGGTDELALLAKDMPLDRFETYLDPDAARMNRRVWILRHRDATQSNGYVNKGQAQRALDMIRDAKVEILAWQPQPESL